MASSHTLAGTIAVERLTLLFWRRISIWRIPSACCQELTRACAMSVTRRFWKVPKRRSILPLACGVGATRWAMPRARKARWNWLFGSAWSLLELGPKRLNPSV